MSQYVTEATPDSDVAQADLPIIPFSKFRLDNGLTVIAHEDHKAPVVAVSIWYHVGSADEPAGKTGFAHLFEHLMFSGSEHHKDVFFKPFEMVGATDQNGTTWFDRTNYFETVPTTALDMALWMESDRMGHLLGAIGQEELDTQRGVVQNEKRQNENQPYGRVMENIQLHAFPENHPYQHTTIGSMADLDAASLEDVRQWFRSFYGAANTTLVLAGDITPAQAREKAIEYFGDIPAGPPVAHQSPWIAPRTESTRGALTDQVAQVRLMREWNVPYLGHKDTPLLELAATVLGGGTTSRLYQRLVHRDQLADSVSVGMHTLALASMFLTAVDVRQGIDPAAVEAVIAEEWANFLEHGPTEDELTRAKTTLRSAFVRGLEKVGGFTGKAVILAEGQVYRGDPEAFRVDFARREAAMPASVLAAAKRWLARGDYTLTVFPAGTDTASSADEATMPGLPAMPDKPAETTMPARSYTTTESRIDRRLGVPRVERFPELSFPAIQRARLKNGIEVVLAERHAIPVTHVLLQFDAGLAADQGRKLGTAKTVISMLDEGTTSRNSVQIAEQQQRLGASIRVSSGLDTCDVHLSTLNSGLAGALELLADMVRHPAFRATDLERIRAQTLAAIQQELSHPSALSGRLLPSLMYGAGHAYGMPFSGLGTEDSIRSLEEDDLFAFHRDWIRPEKATIFVAGDTTMEAILRKLEATFGDWSAPMRVSAKNLGYVAAPKHPRLFLVHRANADQSQIVAGHLVAPTPSPWYLPMQLANSVFGGMFTSRLNMNLREDKRWTYGARSVIPDAIGQRPLMIAAPVQSDKTAESIREIVNELKAIVGERPPSTDEIDKIKAQSVRTLPGTFEGAGSVLQTMAGNRLYGRPDDYVQQLKQSIEAQTQTQVAAAAQELFSPDAFTWLVIGDLGRIESSVRALHIGEVSVLDAAGHAQS